MRSKKMPKTPEELALEEKTGYPLADEVVVLDGKIFRLIDIHARKKRKATPKSG